MKRIAWTVVVLVFINRGVVWGQVATSTPTMSPSPTFTLTPVRCGNNVIDAGEQCDPPGPACPLGGGSVGFCNAQCFCGTATPTLVPPTRTPSKTPTGTFTASPVPPSKTPTRTRTPDLRPTIMINDIVALEGNAGPVSRGFVVTLSRASTQTVTVAFTTANGTALAGQDYVTISGTLSFPPGATGRTILFSVIGDIVSEPNETFFMVFSNPTNATLPKARAQITILADDTIGTALLTPGDSVTRTGERTTLTLTWTHPLRWRDLNTIDLRLEDTAGIVLWLRFDEAANTFSVCETVDSCGPGLVPGTAGELHTDFATVFLQDSAVLGSGPTGPSVDLIPVFTIDSAAAGRLLHVEAAATDDSGNVQDFEEVGTLTVQGAGSDNDDGCAIGAHPRAGCVWMVLVPLALVWRWRAANAARARREVHF